MSTPAEGGEAARLVRTVVCAYRRELPVAWLQVFRRFEHAIDRAGLDVRVRLYPIEELPKSFEVLVVPPELRARAAAVARGAWVIAATRETAAAAAMELLAELSAGSSLRAERRQPGAPRTVTLRGYEEL